MSVKTCKQHANEPIFIYAQCAACEIQRYRDQEKVLKTENESLRKSLSDILELYESDEGCRNLPQYVAGRAAINSPENP